MKYTKTAATLCTVFLLAACGETKPVAAPKARPDFTGNPAQDIVALLPVGSVTVECMDGVPRDARLSQLYGHFQKNIREHYEWYVDYLEEHPERPVPFHENFGLDADEYAEMNEHIGNLRYYNTGLQDMKIVRRENGIGFEAEKKAGVFQHIVIDPKKLHAYVDGHELSVMDTVCLATDKNPFGSPWRGYIWHYENPGNIRLEALKDLKNLTLVQYKITLGRLAHSGRTLLTLQQVEVEKGHKLTDVDFSVVF